MTELDPSPAAQPVIRNRAALAGSVAAAAALAFGELPSAFANESQSQILAVGTEFIDRFAGLLKSIAVALFGTNDKPALVVGIVLISLALGARLGIAAAKNFWIGVAGFGFFGLIGMFSGITDPQLSSGVAILSAVFAVGAGIVTLAVLLPFAKQTVMRPANNARQQESPTTRTPDRRSFLVFSGMTGLGAVMVGSISRSMRSSNVEEVRASLTLPQPTDTVAVPVQAATAEFEAAGAPTFITSNRDFYRIDTALTVPQVDVSTWNLRVHGLVDNELSLSYDDILAMDMVEMPVTLQCVSNEVGGGLVGTANWLGVPLADILEQAGVRPEGTQIVGRSVDRFTAGMPTDVALDGRTALVAVGMNGEPLPARSGFPARLVVSGLYGYVSATKWLSDLELVRYEDFDGYWIPRGWAKDAPIKLTARIDVPRPNQSLSAGTNAVAGVAWSPNVGIASVEVRITDGQTEGEWQTARLGPTTSTDTWVQWLYEWDAAPGQYVVECRCTDVDGLVQTGERRPVNPDGATGYHGIFAKVS